MAQKKLMLGHVRGEDGKAPTFSVSAEASADSTASVEQTNGEGTVNLKFKLPKGDKGADGVSPQLQNTTGTSESDAMTQKAVTDAVTWTVEEKNLTTEGWTGETSPYSQEVTIAGLTENEIVYVTYKAGVTAEQIDAFASSCITASEQKAGSIKLQALRKPTIALPIMVMYGGITKNGGTPAA